VLDALGCFDDGGPLTLGFTATPQRRGVCDVFEEITFEADLIGMIRSGWLADLRGVSVGVDVDFSTVATVGGDYSADDLGQRLAAAGAPDQVAEGYRVHAAGRRALVFCPTVELAHATTQAFRSAGIAAETIVGTMAPAVRADVLDRFRTGETAVVANVGVLTEGVDLPFVDCIVIARPTRSRVLFEQMIGRGTRIFEGKTECVVLDLIGATAEHSLAQGPVRLADLAGVTPAPREGLAAAGERGRVHASAGALHAAAVDLFGRVNTRWLSEDRIGFLSVDGGVVAIGADWAGRGWVVVLVRQRRHYRHGDDLAMLQGAELTEVVGGQVVEVHQALDRDDARSVADYLVDLLGCTQLVNRKAPWRSRPASTGQMRWVRDLVELPPGAPHLTQGEASDLIAAAQARQGWALARRLR
jgi:hypothetical protein